MQLIDSLQVKWKALIRNNPSPINQAVSKYTLCLQETPIAITLPLTSKAYYGKLIKQTQTNPTSQLYWEQIIRNADDEYHPYEIHTDCKKIYLLPRRATIESYTRSFQYKIINNALFLNKKLFNMGHYGSWNHLLVVSTTRMRNHWHTFPASVVLPENCGKTCRSSLQHLWGYLSWIWRMPFLDMFQLQPAIQTINKLTNLSIISFWFSKVIYMKCVPAGLRLQFFM